MRYKASRTVEVHSTFPRKIKESKMVHITLNCLIIPIGGFFELPRDEVIQAIPIYTSQDVSALETAIQERLGEPFKNNSLDIRQVHPGSVPEKSMNSQAQISIFFPKQPLPRFIHVTVYPCHNNF
ncbi:hypothetical protein C1646_777247 [Rhizophagus diaphanus]|nr:hypothetical protein C1646_777247 [Rhizophagus diaphanus] [Rhizophagus sp. MUCL 43196]